MKHLSPIAPAANPTPGTLPSALPPLRNLSPLRVVLFALILLWSWVGGHNNAVSANQPEPEQQIRVSAGDLNNDGDNDMTVETDLFRLAISGYDGQLLYFFLKGKNFDENIFPPNILDHGYNIASPAIQGLEATYDGSVRNARHFDLTIERPAPNRVSVIATSLVSDDDGGKPVFGLTRRFDFSTGRYAFDITTIISNRSDHKQTVGGPSSPGMVMQFGPGLFLDKVNPAQLIALQHASHQAFDSPEALLKAAETNSFIGVGMKTQYFCFLLEARQPITLTAKRFDVTSSDPRRKPMTGDMVGVAHAAFDLVPQQSQSFSFQIYLGPKTLKGLKEIHREAVTDYGFLSTVLLHVLQFFHALIPNYGVAIVLLTLFVRVMLYPLTLKQTKSMAQIQKIQPLVQDLKDRYKDDTQKFNEEVLKLYQKHNVNPFGGCLPLLLQLPILFALYNTINIAVEIRKTPFLWIPDLSMPDPLILLPIGIAGLMYYQQGKMTDPQQQQMMMFMPMFMFVITWTLPAGLLVYWFTSTVLGLLQQIQASKLSLAAKEE